MHKPCLICHRVNRVSQGSSVGRTTKESMKRFFQLLERYLHETNSDDGEDNTPKFNSYDLHEYIDYGMVCCGDCSKIVEFFSEIYHQMKSLELVLNNTLLELQTVMSTAQNMPIRVNAFSEYIQQLQFCDGDGATEAKIINFKTELIHKCQNKLSNSFPKLVLKKLKSVNEFKAVDDFPNENPVEFKEDVELSNSELRSLHSCTKCPKTLSTSVKFEEHMLAHDTATDERFFMDPQKADMDVDNDDNDTEEASVSAHVIDSDSDRYHETGSDDNDGERKEILEHCLQNQVPESWSESSAIKSEIVYVKLEDTSSYSKSYPYEDNEEDTVLNSADMEETGFSLEDTSDNPGTVVKEEDMGTVIPQGELESTQSKSPKRGSNKNACETCGKIYKYRKALQRHTRVHHLQLRKFACIRCDAYFTGKEHLDRHHINVHLELNRKDRVTRNNPNYVEENLQLPEYVCNVCGADFTNKHRLRRHHDAVHLGKKWKDKVAKNNQNVEDKKEPQILEYPCEVCGEIFYLRRELRMHINAIHLQLPDYVCNLCGKNFTREDHLVRHRQNIHSSLKRTSNRLSKQKQNQHIDRKL